MKFGSVCSGIEAASVAWHPLGWKAAWLSEIEPFPCAVLKHHYPDVPNLGDMTLLPERILSGEIEAPDLFCGGTPCQAFSVAGLRKSLDDARGNLSLTFCEIANAIDEMRSVRGLDQSIVFWENVPGVLNTKDNAFGCFLGALAGEDDALIPPGDRWTNAGFIDGPQRAVAWRVLDAQYFGVAQRRRRVFVVASARADFDPAAVLFEFDGLRRDIAPSREKRKRIADTLTVGANQCSGFQGDFVEAQAMVVQPSFAIQGSMIGRNDNAGPQGDGINEEICFTQNTIDRHAVAQPIAFEPGKMQRLGYGNAKPGLAPTLRADAGDNQLAVAFQETADCLTAAYGTKWNGNASATNGSLFASQAISLQDVTPREKAQNGRGWNDDGTAYTVDTHATQGVAQPITKRYDSSACADRGQNVLAQPIPIDTMNMTPGHSSGGLGFGQPGDPSFTLTKGHSHAVAQPIGWSEELTASIDLAGTIQRGGQGGRHDGVMTPAMQVRRLTPVECERLQGFPDNYTNIKDKCPDGPRYKALGNSWAVPVVRWIGQRIANEIA